MLHELSHIRYPFITLNLCRSMTHGPLFWKTYNILKKEMTALDAKGYTGEGFYSRPYTLTDTVPLSRQVTQEEIPEHICGGTWQRQKRTRRKTGGRKRKFKGEGIKIGQDEEKRKELERGKGNKKVLLLMW
jgi:DNA-dependent metalloprotease WSS1